VYDGHGGSEVAAYCAQKLPEFLKQLDSYKKGNYEEALKEAFLGFDATLLEDKNIEVLKNLAKKNPDEDGSTSEEEDDDENIADLCSEASMPLNEVLEKYKGNPNIDKLKEGNSSKPLSPFLRGKRNAGNDEGASGSGSSSGSSPRKTNNSAAAAASSSSGSSSSKKVLSMDAEDDQVSSSSMKADTGSTKTDANAEPCSSSADNEVNLSKQKKAEVVRYVFKV
jgi:protein phosphatase 1G